MEEMLRSKLLAKTQQAMVADDWEAIRRLWQPWAEEGEAEAEFQLAYHHFLSAPADDQSSNDMMQLLRNAASKGQPDAIWFLATLEFESPETNPEFAREVLRAGRLGSVHAQRLLGVLYATGDWSGPTDQAEAAYWYRLAAEQGHAEAQYDLGFMMLLGEGGARNPDEALMWLERAGNQGQSDAVRLLVDCLENGYCGVPADAAKGQYWRSRLDAMATASRPSQCPDSTSGPNQPS